jgi:Family of unknown function (DUF6516)
MPRDLFLDYFDDIEQRLISIPNLYVEQFNAVIISNDRANLKLRLRFELQYSLSVSEAIVLRDRQITFLDYRYHFQDNQNNLVFRYDSTPHFPDLPTFPHHKHLPDTVIACDKPKLTHVLEEITELLMNME